MICQYSALIKLMRTSNALMFISENLVHSHFLQVHEEDKIVKELTD